MIDAAWWDRCVRLVDAPPERARLPLRWVDHRGACPATMPSCKDLRERRIGSIESSVALALAGAGAPLRDAGDAWQIEAAASESPDATFARIARALRDTGLAGAWRNELLEVTDAAGVAVGAIERAAVRPLGITTDAVHLIAHRADGRVWVQLRALDKATDPGLWDTTMGWA